MRRLTWILLTIVALAMIGTAVWVVVVVNGSDLSAERTRDEDRAGRARDRSQETRPTQTTANDGTRPRNSPDDRVGQRDPCDRVPEGVTCESGIPITDAATIDVYQPPNEPPVPVVVLVHGGGWVGGDAEQVLGMARKLTQAGYAAVGVQYTREAPEDLVELQVSEIDAAFTWIRDHAAERGFDPERITMIGTSAGGHLAALVATTVPEPGLQAVVTYSGPTDLYKLVDEADLFPEWASQDVPRKVATALGCSLEDCPDRFRSLSPVQHVDGTEPAMLLVVAEHEFIPQDQATVMADRLRAAGVEAEVHIAPVEGHGKGLTLDEGTWNATVDFLGRHS